MAAKKHLLNHAQAVPSYDEILRPHKQKPSQEATDSKEQKRSKAYHLRDTTINAVAEAGTTHQVPIGDLVDFLLTEGLKAIGEGRLEIPVKQGKKRIILS